MACPHCGSWAVRSDRALAGRMVCGRCGQPLGRVAGSQQSRGLRRRFGVGWNGGQRLGLIVLGLVAISAVLAGLDNRTRDLGPPAWEGGSHWSR